MFATALLRNAAEILRGVVIAEGCFWWPTLPGGTCWFAFDDTDVVVEEDDDDEDDDDDDDDDNNLVPIDETAAIGDNEHTCKDEKFETDAGSNGAAGDNDGTDDDEELSAAAPPNTESDLFACNESGCVEDEALSTAIPAKIYKR